MAIRREGTGVTQDAAMGAVSGDGAAHLRLNADGRRAGLAASAPIRACLILAAGRGSRMRQAGETKPLLRLGGIPLIERTIVSASRAGLTQFYVVTGHQAAALESFLRDLAWRRRLSITAIRSSAWEAGNGASLLAARHHIREPFVLLMADHLFDEAVLARLLRSPLGTAEAVLAADVAPSLNDLIDPREATKVRIRGGRITAIGKDLENYEAYDTGMFLCTPAVFEAAQRSCLQGDVSVSGAIRELARLGQASVHPVTKAGWLDVDTPDDRLRAKVLLLSRLAKGHDGWVSRRLNRPLSSRVVTPLLLWARPSVTPNQVTLLGLVLALAAAFAFLVQLPLAAGILIHLTSIVDGSDGEIARLKKLETSFGGFLDAICDRYGDSFILVAMGYFAFVAMGGGEALGGATGWAIGTIVFLAIAGHFMVSYTSSRAQVDLGYRYGGRLIAAGRGRDLRLLILAVAAALAALEPRFAVMGVATVAALTNGIVLCRVVVARRVDGATRPALEGPIRAVILDFDGTVADTMPFLTELAVGLLTDCYGLVPGEAEHRYRETSGRPFHEQIESIFPGHAANEGVVAEFEERKRASLLDQPPFPGALAALRSLGERGLARYIVSSTSVEALTAYAARFGLCQVVDGLEGYQPGFDKAAQIRAILAQGGLPAREAVFVGDSAYDRQLAADLGLHFIGIREKFRAGGESEPPPDRVTQLSDLVPYVAPFRTVSEDDARGVPTPA